MGGLTLLDRNDPAAPRGQRRGGFPLWAIAIAVGVLWAIGARDFGADGYFVPWLGASVVFLGLLPALVRDLRKRRGLHVQPIPFLPLIGVIFAVYYGLPVLISDRVTGLQLEAEVWSIKSALWLSLIGWCALLAGYCLSGGRLRHLRPLALEWDPGRARRLAFLLLPVGFAAAAAHRLFDLPGALAQPTRLAASLLPVGIGIAILLGRRGVLSRGATWFAWLVLAPAYLAIELSGGLLGAVVMGGLLLCMLIWGTGGRIPLWVFALGAVAIVTLRAGAHDFRRMMNNDDHLLASNPIQRAGQLLSLSFQALPEQSFADRFEKIADRFSQVVPFAFVIERTPAAIPHWGGETYASLPSTFIPRFLWPDKPVKDVGQRFGHRYGILDAEDRKTSINLPQLVEFYANFGATGVLVGMFLLGAGYRLLDQLLNGVGAADANVLVAAVVFSSMANIESDLSMIFGLAIQTTAVLYIVLRLSRRVRGSGASRPAPGARPAAPLGAGGAA